MRRRPRFLWQVMLLGGAVAIAIAVPVAILLSQVGGPSSVATLIENPSLLAGVSATSTTPALLTTTTQPTSGSTIGTSTTPETTSTPTSEDYSRVTEINSSSEGGADNWVARVGVRVVTANSPQGLAGALVVGTWAGAIIATQTTITDSTGVAEFVMTGLTGPSTRFTVLDVIVEAVPYEPTTNEATTVKVPGPAS